ncbi:YggS family pyridoxal phosphate-dependent enzyme [Methylocystis echinoides]|uniref:YggS family pyridoxal phosphate-dependent enzyme n=1 Tax=Methylocystis echinoides TaxID=29468 RepID=UPI00343D527A
MSIIDRLNDTKAAIRRAADDCERDPASVTLVCVTKTFPAEDIVPLLEAGHRVFGENRVQEAMGKWPGLRERFAGVELHLIGPLQSNKTREAVETFDVIQSVDREKIAAALAEEMKKQGKRPRLFVQINTGAEPQKAGVLPQDADAFIAACREKYGLEISGLMCVPPVDEQASPHFALLADIAARNGLEELSMGMSSDYEFAIQLGATYVRVGSAIMGTREYAKS